MIFFFDGLRHAAWWQLFVRVLAAFGLASLAACATSPVNLPVNRPLLTQDSASLREPPIPFGENTVMLSFSGGGTRAAAFALGALQGLEGLPQHSKQSLLDNVAFISGVSGGSLLAAYYGLHGKESLSKIREILLKDGEAQMRFSLLNPVNLMRVWSGGLNDRSSLRNWLDDDIFHGATYADMFRRGKPVVWVNATDVYHRLAFPFNQMNFDALCSDLANFPVAEAVAASMAVPLVFSPIVIEKHTGNCAALAADLKQQEIKKSMLYNTLARTIGSLAQSQDKRYIKLIDGGVVDNFGLASLQQAGALHDGVLGPLSEQEAIQIKRLLYVVVDAGQAPSGDWLRSVDGPSGVEMASAAIDVGMATNMRLSYDIFGVMLQRLRDDVVRWRCQLPPERQRNITDQQPGWRCDDVNFSLTRVAFDQLNAQRAQELGALPTRLKLPADDVDKLIRAGQELIQSNSVVREFQRHEMMH